MVKTLLAGAFGLVVVIISVYGLQYIEDVQSAFDVNPSKIAISVGYFLLMLAGAFASERYKYFTSNPLAGRNFFQGMSYSYLYRSLLVSPIVFGAVVSYIGRDANVIMAAIFSFQNGFFWEIVFSHQAKNADTSSARTRRS